MGEQVPRLLSVPPGTSGRGEEAAELAAAAGLVLDPWQRFVLDASLREGEDGKWASDEVCLIVARQQGKGAILEARELAGLFLFDEQQILHTAHEYKTSEKAFLRVRSLIDSLPSLSRRVKRCRSSPGQNAIEMHSGAELRFVARTAGSGRGFTADLVILDEAYDLTEQKLAALAPTQVAVDNPQMWYTSSAVDQETMPNGEVLARVRERGLAGGDGLAFFEWSAESDDDRDDPATWAKANPALGVRLGSDAISKARKQLTPRTFEVENLSIGDWPSSKSDENEPVIDDATWRSLVDRSPVRSGHFVLTVEATPDEQFASIAQGVKTERGVHAQVIYHGPFDRAEVVKRIKAVRSRSAPTAVLLDPKSAAGAFRIPLEDAGVEVTPMTLTHVKEACRDFLVRVRDGEATHDDDPRLMVALEQARLREFSDGSKAWERHSGEISQLVALTHAVWGVSAFRPQVINAAPLKSVPATVPGGAGPSWQSMSF